MTAGRSKFEVVIGTDGSASGQAAVDAATRFPWPARAGAVLVVATRLLPARIGGALRAEAARLTSERRRKLTRIQRTLRLRLHRAGWKVQDVVRIATPLAGLLDAAKAGRADVLVIGARGTGGVERLLLGSVAEGAMARAPMSVLVVR
jgi:nucleotide-binding universal stress UspA family protein